MKARLNILFIVVTFLCVTITMIVMGGLYYDLNEEHIYDHLKSDSVLLEKIYEGAAGNELAIENEEFRITLINKEGQVIYDSLPSFESEDNHLQRKEVKMAIENGEGYAVRKSDTLDCQMYYYATMLEDGKILRIGKTDDSTLQMYIYAMPVMLLLLLAVSIICIVCSHLMAKKIVTPINYAMAHIDDIQGNYSRYHIYKELEPIIETIRLQHENLLESVKVRQEFTAGVSHELKTPLTAILGYSELMENGMVSENDVHYIASHIRKNSERLLTLINDVIKLSEFDGNTGKIKLTQVDLKEIVEGSMNVLKVSAIKNEVTIINKCEPVIVTADKEMMDELVMNLCDNAIKYNVKNGSVIVSTYVENGRGVLSVEDNGIGMTKENKERIFERFFRVDKSRSREKGGSGLGLSIVKHIVEIHNADIVIDSEPGKGTIIRVFF